MVTPSMIGGRGEAVVAAEFLRYGIPVYRPVVDTGADLVVEINGKLQKVQVKSSASEARRLGFHFGRRDTKKNDQSGWVLYEDEPDWYALCCLYHGYVALLPPGAKCVKLTFNESCTERLNNIEIGNVIGRLLEGDK